MIKVKIIIFSVLSILIILSDLIITPYNITYADRPILAFIGIILVSFIDTKMADAKNSSKLRKIFFSSMIVLFFTGLVLSFTVESYLPTFPFVVGCALQSLVYLRALLKAEKTYSGGTIRLYEAPIPAIGYRIMSLILIIRDLLLDHKKHLESAGIKEGDYVLDFGCGPGAFSFAASKIVGENGMVYALDNQHLSIESINRKVKKLGIKNIKTIYSNQCETGLPDRSIDKVLLIGVLHLIRNPENLFNELTRVMKDDASLLVVPVHIPRKELHDMLTPMFTFTEKINIVDILKKA